MPNKISVVSLGCPKNLVDSDKLTQRLISNGFSYLNMPEAADIILVNTCGFIEDAKKESIEEILRLADIKKGLRGQKAKGTRKLVAFGCLAKRYREQLLKEIPEIDAIFGVGEEEKIVEYCKGLKRRHGDTETRRSKDSLFLRFTPSPIHPFSSYAYLKIADGCNKKCSYCVIPSIRGAYRSISPDNILKDAEHHIQAGVKELILVAQDTACYGNDLNGYDISRLLKDICSISGDFWVRLLYAYPDSISNSLINTIAGENKICKYLDIPLQHSEDRILKLMGRKGTRKGYLSLIKKIRHNIPDIALRTTFIVGFPSETEEELNSLIDFIENVRFDKLGVFKYSKEEGTPASKLSGHITKALKNKRFNMIMQHQARISLEKNKELVGRQFKAVIDEVNDNIAVCRLYSHAPEIDGVVIINSAEERKSSSAEVEKYKTSELPRFLASSLKAGSFISVKITDAHDYDLNGIMVR
ncbi:MAG: 30S ribosomal protein S12 methylthiotransferase RimO [Nitrospirae bacterium]|nr:30S ribosomal protein S12 methylthiotransferase RimO [Nitrospirota bacterium]